MKKVKLSFGTYNCIPNGLSTDEVEESYQSIYKPFLSLLYSYREIPVVLYYSGFLLEWLQNHHPEFIMLLNEMVSRKQIEFLGGGFYNPIFTMIPVTDRIGQIELLTTYLRKTFGKRPRGCWLTEGVWEQNITTSIRNSGIDYIYLDERCFSLSGLTGSDLFYPVTTEDQGKVVTVFPITNHIAEGIPQTSPEEVMAQILEHASRKKDHLISLILPGDIFYQESGEEDSGDTWLSRFLSLIIENREKVEMFHPARFLRDPPRTRKIYFETYTPSSIPRDEGVRSFRRLLNRYYEGNNLYSKMIYTHTLVTQMRGDKSRKKAAREEIWKGQNHFAYWNCHNGGIKRNSIRKAAYHAFIESEKLTREKGIFQSSLVLTDYDMDGIPEFLYQGEEINVYLHQYGASVFELDYLPKAWNYLDTFSGSDQRDGKAQPTSEQSAESFSRNSFLDHFLPLTFDFTQFCSSQTQELGDFLGKEYRVKTLDKDKDLVTFVRDGKINMGSYSHSLELEKQYQFQNNSLSLLLRITNLGDKKISCLFAEEINLSFQGEGPGYYQVFSQEQETRSEIVQGREEKKGLKELILDDKRNHIYLNLQGSDPFSLYFEPQEIEANVKGRELREYQGTLFLLKWDLNLERGKTWETTLSLTINKKRGKKGPQSL